MVWPLMERRGYDTAKPWGVLPRRGQTELARRVLSMQNPPPPPPPSSGPPPMMPPPGGSAMPAPPGNLASPRFRIVGGLIAVIILSVVGGVISLTVQAVRSPADTRR